MEQKRLSLKQKTRKEITKIQDAMFYDEQMKTDKFRIVEEILYPAGLETDLVAIGINKAIWNTK